MAPLETPARLEPCQLPTYSEKLADLISAVTASATTLGARLHPLSASSLADLVRVMNCYYSNLIEGHDPRPRDIEPALFDQLETEPERRNLQLEARAHIRVQRAIDELHAKGELAEPATTSFIRWVHEEFYADAPAELLTISRASGSYRMQPGMFRHETKHDNVVGRHVPHRAPWCPPSWTTSSNASAWRRSARPRGSPPSPSRTTGSTSSTPSLTVTVESADWWPTPWRSAPASALTGYKMQRGWRSVRHPP